MNVIYADSLFLLNAAIDYLLLLAVCKLCSLPRKRLRLLLSACLGGAYALAEALGPGWLSSPLVRVAAGAALVWSAFGGIKALPRAIICFYAVAALFGGAVYAGAGLAGLPQAGTGYVGVSTRVLLLSFAVCYAAVSLVFRAVGRRSERATVRIELEFLGRPAAFTALVDSGNELRDPISGERVIVAEAEALAPLLPPLTLPEDPAEALRQLSAAEGCGGKFRLIPCSCVTGGASLLLCFRPDKLSIDGRSEPSRPVALTGATLSATGEYRGII